MLAPTRPDRSIFAISDLHVTHPENRVLLDRIVPESAKDWLLVCGDVSEDIEDVWWALDLLRSRFAKVVWVPGNHELWTDPGDNGSLRGEWRYLQLVAICRSLGVISPEDPYPMWDGPGGPTTVVPLFLLYDYTFGVNVAPTKEQALARAHDAGIVCSDEFLLHPDPYASREAWCHARVSTAESRLAMREASIPTILLSHFPLVDAPTRALLHPEFAQWCGTALTADWHRRFDAAVVVYGHLHIPRTTWQNGVRFEEVSLGYPREWQHRKPLRLLRRILPAEAS